ncbi:hypothetical protein BsIDN1_48090 [Bacillus safensis]|uniref:Bypass-of-forespore C N-terminal domain-containing protein n=1 Tax=Bacillus safensis TaxID=561879 RepID=A0A5S9ME31_BACIA|nr:hypothetical protein BsIDN1_48090 [Bacillus safensis]
MQKQSNSITVQLEKVYLDGDVSIERHRASLEDKDTFWAQYKGWTLVEQKKRILPFLESKLMISLH